MPITSQLDPSRELTTFVGKGKVSIDDILEMLKPFFEGQVTKNILWDFREATPDIGDLKGQLRRLVKTSDRARELRSDGKTALIASSDLVYGLLRMYQTFAELRGLAHKVRVFRAMEEAHQWLDVGEDTR